MMFLVELNELNYVTQAEEVIKGLRKQNRRGEYSLPLTTSKIRNLLSMVTDIYNEIVHETQEVLSADIQGRVQYLKMRFAYEAGREQSVREFVEKAGIFNHIDRIKASREQLILFCKYMEALVAYHMYYGGRD